MRDRGSLPRYSLSPRLYIAVAIVIILYKAGYTLGGGTFEESIGGRDEGPGISPRLYLALAMVIILHNASYTLGGVNRRPPCTSVGGSEPGEMGQ